MKMARQPVSYFSDNTIAEYVSRARYLREKCARQEAEKLLGEKSLELFNANCALKSLNASLEHQVKERTQALEKASKAREEFLARMSHELRTPLNAIIGFSECIAQQHFGPNQLDQYTDYASLIHSSGQHLLDLINDILDYSKLSSGNRELVREETNISKSVNDAVAMVAKDAEKKDVQLICRIQPDLPNLMLDRRAVFQVLLNLLSNAVKHTPAGGRVAVMSRMGKTELRLVVADTGSGVASEQLELILEPFMQAANSDPHTVSVDNPSSTGLGLPIARSLVELHEGQLKLRSTPGKGTVVSVHFPRGEL